MSPRTRLLQLVILRVVIPIAAAGGVIYLVYDAFGNRSPFGGFSSTIIVGAGTVSGVVAVTTFGSALYTTYRRRQLDTRLTELQDAAEGTVTDSDERFQSVAVETRRLLEYKTLQRNEAESELARYLPSNPRRAKRLVNHERLYAQIAEDRHVYGGRPNLSRLHLAKWVLILEYWPRLGAALTHHPENMEHLERATSLHELAAALSDAGLKGTAASDALLRVLQSGEPLAPVLGRLVRFEAAPPEPDSSEAAELVASGNRQLPVDPG
jgi:hypothetical protein